MNSRNRPRLALLTSVAGCLVLLSTSSYAQTQRVTLAWDASPEPSVSGYIVYVGNASGSYTERHDVGSQTTFEYNKVTSGVPYFFAVAAYAPGRGVGPRSEETFFLAGATAATASSIRASTTVAGLNTAAAIDSRAALCTSVPVPDCASVSVLADVAGQVRAPAPTGDGRLLFIENGVHVRVLAGDSLVPRTALMANPGTELGALVLDPSFERTRLVYATEIESGADGSRRLNIVRYREVANTLGERATIVTGIPLPHDGDAPLAVDGAGRLYLAVPAAADGAQSAYGGMVLRFESDGSVSRDSRGGSPVLAYGHARPVTLAWSGQRNELWLAGSDASGEAALSLLPLEGTTTEWPRVPRATTIVEADSSIVSLYAMGSADKASASSAADERSKQGELLAVDDAGSMLRIDAWSLAVAQETRLAELGGTPASAAFDADYLYVVLTVSGGDASRIVRLRRISN